MITFAILSFIFSRARKYFRGKGAAPIALILAVTLLCAATTPGAYADSEFVEQFETSAEEVRADAADAAFDQEFELFSDPSVVPRDIDDPDWQALLRPKVRQRVGKKKYVYVTPSVEYGVVFTGPSYYREGASKSIAPASTSKIFTAALALKYLGSEFKFENSLTWRKSLAGTDAGYVKLIGSGDPSFNAKRVAALIDEMVEVLHAAKVKRFYGAVEYQATDDRWSLTVKPSGWESGDPTPLDAFGMVSENTVRRTLAAKLRAKGIQWIERASAPFLPLLSTEGEAKSPSKPLKTLIQPFMLNSINSFGEALLRKVGEKKGSRYAANLHVAGLVLLREYVYANVGRNTILLNDGSGLSRTSRVTADAMIKFLDHLKLEPFFEDLLDSFPVAGRTGTLKGRMRGTSAAGKIHAKTGTIDGNYQLAGYLADSRKTSTEYHPFEILTDTKTSYSSYCRKTQNEVLSTLASTK